MQIKDYLIKYGLTHFEFALLVDCHPSYVSSLSLGKVPITKKMARAIERGTQGKIKVDEIWTKGKNINK